MTLPSQFSLEEENFYKDIQDLLKNSSQNEKELSSFLQRYMDLLAKADLDDESFIINFTKAGLIIEASAKVYGTKVDRLWNNLEHVLMSLRSRSHEQSKNKTVMGEEIDMEADESRRRMSVNSRKRKKMGDVYMSADDFVEIDNITGLLGKNMNENVNKNPGNLKFCEKVPNMFIKNKQKKKKIDVCLNKTAEEKDVIRLRDWVVSTECLLIKEIHTSSPANNSTNEMRNESFGLRREVFDALVDSKSNTLGEASERIGKETFLCSNEYAAKEDLKDKSINFEVTNANSSKKSVLEKDTLPPDKDIVMDILTENDCFENDLNISKESDLAKFPNVVDRGPKAYLVDVDEVFWDAEKFQNLIPNRKLRSGKAYKTLNPPCRLCKHKMAHQGKKIGKRCLNKKKKESGLDSYFIPHVQPTIGEPQFGILPDEELYSTFKQESKIIEQLAKVNATRNINEAFHPDENPEELKNFLGFDAFEKRLLRLTEYNEDEVEADFEDKNADEELNFADNPAPVDDFELPVPVTVDSCMVKITETDCDPLPNDDYRLAETEYHKLVKEGLKDHYEAKSVFAKNKELGKKISKWHSMISDKIKLSEKRGAMNMKSLANKIMTAFPSPAMGKHPQMSFRQLVRNQCQRDIPRYFFGCLQLTNEGNLDISRTDPRPLVTDCMVITQLRSTRKNCDLDESTAKSPTKEAKTPKANRKLNALTKSPVMFENKSPRKKKATIQRTQKAPKRKKNFAAPNNAKKISEEIERMLEIGTENASEWNESERESQISKTLGKEEKKDAENPKRQKKTVTLESDFFQEVDDSIALSGDTINENPDKNPEKVKLYDNVFKIFVKNKTKKKRTGGEGRLRRLRDWIITTETLLVKEMYSKRPQHKQYDGNKGNGEKTLLSEGTVIRSLPMGAKENERENSDIERVRKSKSKERNMAELSNFSEISVIKSHKEHNFVKIIYSTFKSENLIPVTESSANYDFIRKNNHPGPSNTNMAQQTVYKRQENFTAPQCPKKAKF